MNRPPLTPAAGDVAALIGEAMAARARVLRQHRLMVRLCQVDRWRKRPTLCPTAAARLDGCRERLAVAFTESADSAGKGGAL